MMNYNEGYESFQLAAIGAKEAAVRQVDYALAEVMKNIADPNTDIDAKRVVTLKIELKPAKDRRSADITATVTSKLSGDSPVVSHVLVGKNGKGLVPMAEQLEMEPVVASVEREAKDAD
jgi:hypothetical protein